MSFIRLYIFKIQFIINKYLINIIKNFYFFDYIIYIEKLGIYWIKIFKYLIDFIEEADAINSTDDNFVRYHRYEVKCIKTQLNINYTTLK